MSKKLSVEKLQSRWSSYAAFARSVGVSEGAAQQWRIRGSIPPEYWADVVDAAKRDGVQGVTIQSLLEMRTGRATHAA
jgi:hypothetical protein